MSEEMDYSTADWSNAGRNRAIEWVRTRKMG